MEKGDLVKVGETCEAKKYIGSVGTIIDKFIDPDYGKICMIEYSYKQGSVTCGQFQEKDLIKLIEEGEKNAGMV